MNTQIKENEKIRAKEIKGRTERTEISKKQGRGKGKLSRLFILLVTFSLILILLVSAPARAFVLNLTLDKTSVDVGGKVVFLASVTINSDETLPVQKLVLELYNSASDETSTCTFNVDGSVIDGCDGITIIRLNGGDSIYGYGYGYYSGYAYNFGYGYNYKDSLLYEITLDTHGYSAGDYTTKLSAFINGNVFSKSGEVLKIKSPIPISGHGGGTYQVTDGKDVICLNSWQCTEWSGCESGYQYRTCGQTRSDCLLTPKPAQERECALQLTSSTNAVSGFNLNSLNNLNNYSPDGSDNSDNLSQELPDVQISLIRAAGGLQMLIILLLMAGIVGLLLAIDIVLLIQRSRRARRIRRLRRIMYRPVRK